MQLSIIGFVVLRKLLIISLSFLKPENGNNGIKHAIEIQNKWKLFLKMRLVSALGTQRKMCIPY